MQPKTIGKRSVDLAMTLLLLLLMARQITGETAHEWLGAGMLRTAVSRYARVGRILSSFEQSRNKRPSLLCITDEQ